MIDTSSSPPAQKNAASGVVDPAPAPNAISTHAVELLRRTRPWVLFLSVISFGSSVFLAITTVFFLFGVSSAFGFSKGEVWFRVFGNAMMMGIYLIASVFLFRFTRAVRNLAQNRDNAALGHFLDTLRKLWKCLGIIVVVILAQWLVFLLAAPVFGAKAQNAPGDTAQEVPIESSTD